MIWVMIGVATILSCELFCRIAIIKSVLAIKATTLKAARVLKSKTISDHWKEWILPRYAFRVSKNSILLLLYLVLALCPFLLFGLFSSFLESNFFKLISKPFPIVGITIFALLYMAMRKKWGYLFALKKNNLTPKYSFTSKLLHHLALNSNIRCELYFDIEKFQFSNKKKSSGEGQHVFICGLARSGSTVLMRAFYRSDKFSSLTYRDMPFVLAPNMWLKITSRNSKSMQKEIRAHDDGILVDFDSPEALEEVFWRVFAGASYIHSNHLSLHQVDDDLLASFRDYVSLINSRYSRNRYLSKNNNNILRLSGITDAFPNSILLIPFREPLQHAFSLLKQHKNFSMQHREDEFSEKYMSWLAHHEFGHDHRPFMFVDDIYQNHDLNTIDYWLCQWINTYSYLLEQINKTNGRIFFIGYEDICHKDRVMWEKLADIAEIPRDNDFDFILQKAITPSPINENLKQKASGIYFKLLTDSRKRLGLDKMV